MIVGYVRVSSNSQDLTAQIETLKQKGCEKIFEEKKSGRGELEILKQCIDFLREGDTLFVYKLDRLGRETFNLISTVKKILDKKVNLSIIKDNIDFNSTHGKILLMAFSMVAECEAEFNKERRELARSVGRVGGRPKGLSKEAQQKAKKAADLYQAKQTDGSPVHTVTDICKSLQISKRTFYKYLDYMTVTLDREIEF